MQGAAGASEKDPMVVTFTVTNPETFLLKADTPYADIMEAANAGRIVYAFVPNPGPAFGQLTYIEDGELLFNAFVEFGKSMTIRMKSDSDILGLLTYMIFGINFANNGIIFTASDYRITSVGEPEDDTDAATKNYVDNILTAGNSNSVVIKSSTPNSTKKFRITVNDAGAITATEVV